MNTQGYQLWTVPASGIYRFVVAGAKGGDAQSGGGHTPTQGGNGALLNADIELNEGDILEIIVGQRGHTFVTPGGGSFVVKDGTPLLVAGGGSWNSPGGEGGGGGSYYHNSASNISWGYNSGHGYVSITKL